ncbi:MAG: phage integrase SAM-like domain-containing protein [Rikenellaceae bacterium]
MATLKYAVRTSQKSKLAKMYVRLYEGREYDITTFTGYLVLAESWNNKTQSFKSRFTYVDDFTEQEARNMQNKFEDLRNVIIKAINSNTDKKVTKEWLDELINRFHNPDVEKSKAKMSLKKYIDLYIDQIESGERLTVAKVKFAHGSVKAYKGFRERYEEFCKFKRKRFDFNDIDMKFYDDFVAYFTSKSYSINTIGRHVKELKIIMRTSRDEGYHNNGNIESRKFKVVTAKVDNIYLTEAELDAMYNLNLSDKKHLDTARDVFLMGCYTAQRYSDYSVIGEQNIRQLQSGETVIDLKQQKTGSRVIVPARKEALAILAKYDNSLPKTYEQKVNKYIKEVAALAEITEPIEVEQMEEGRLVKTIVPKNELVKTHTARRSGATNMYLSGIPSIYIMKITGHKTEKEFMKYIKASEEETAMELMNHPYFSGR